MVHRLPSNTSLKRVRLAIVVLVGACVMLLIPSATHALLVLVFYLFRSPPYIELSYSEYLAAISDCHGPAPTLLWQIVLGAGSSVFAFLLGYATLRLSGIGRLWPSFAVAAPAVALGAYLLTAAGQMCIGEWVTWFLLLASVGASGSGGYCARRVMHKASFVRMAS
jgi:hypothetical protein